MSEEYIEKIKRLRTDSNRKRWSSITFNRAPHKPFLLLSVIDLFAQEKITGNFIEHSYELVDTFNGYWQKLMPVGSTTSMAYPFPRLANDKIWKLVPNPDNKYPIDINLIFSMVKLRKLTVGAKIDDEFLLLLSRLDKRELLRSTIINKYFDPAVHVLLKEQGKLNYKAFEYCQKILKVDETILPLSDNDQTDKKVRNQAFRKIITSLYKHRCAFCGIRMLTPEGHTVVEAAHVIPWSKSHDDRPTNGMALCKLCHWSFDEGLMSVGKKYEIKVSKRIRIDKNLPGHILSLSSRPIFKPDKKKFWPKQINLERHREEKFC